MPGRTVLFPTHLQVAEVGKADAEMKPAHVTALWSSTLRWFTPTKALTKVSRMRANREWIGSPSRREQFVNNSVPNTRQQRVLSSS